MVSLVSDRGAVVSIPSPLADACPRCFPGDAPAALPAGVTPGETGSLRASYECPACGHEWVCWWDAEAAGWPTPRSAAA
jgi:hypothetical protein